MTLAGFATVEHGHPDDGLKMLQLAQVKSWQIPSDDCPGVAVQAWAKADATTALAALGDSEAAYRELAKARDLWQPARTDPPEISTAWPHFSKSNADAWTLPNRLLCHR